MPSFLLHLQGPLQSWADTGFGQLREAGPFPSRSGVLGIVAAALGIPRAHDDLVALHDAYRVHVATARQGRVLRDFHTVETDPRRSKTLTWRDYHHGAHFVTLLETDDAALHDRTLAALRRPVYTAFLGRRSCPPATPLLPMTPPVTGALDALVWGASESWSTRHARHNDGSSRHERRGRLTCYLDDHADADALQADGWQVQAISHGSRRDKLVAPRRAYVNRSFTRVVLQAPPPVSSSAPTHQTFFDAAP